MSIEKYVPDVNTICETDNYIAWISDEPDGERIYHLELNNITVHFFQEEWQEFLMLAEKIVKNEK
jgi:hypothetical protein